MINVCCHYAVRANLSCPEVQTVILEGIMDMEKLAISRIPAIPQQVKPLKQDPGAKVQGNGGDGAQTGTQATGTATKVAAAEQATGKDPGLLDRIREMQALADNAFANEDLRLSISFDESVGRFIYRGIDPAS